MPENRDVLSDRRERYDVRVSGDTAVIVTTPQGQQHSIRHVGIGHPWHTIGPRGGRTSTAAEYALAKALIQQAESRRSSDETSVAGAGAAVEITGRSWDPKAAGRRAVEKHGDALKRLSDEQGAGDA